MSRSAVQGVENRFGTITFRSDNYLDMVFEDHSANFAMLSIITAILKINFFKELL